MRDETAVFAAVADPRRRQILRTLREGERSAGEIARQFDVSWPAMSRHLRVLREAGLVLERREGRERRYSLSRGRLRGVIGSWIAGLDARYEGPSPSPDQATVSMGGSRLSREDWS